MAWSYDPSDLDKTTPSGRLNVVRLLVGDTNTSDQQIQDEEITFALGETNDSVYYAAAWVANSIASSYARQVDSEIDSTLVAKFSQLHKHYRTLSDNLTRDAIRFDGTSLGVFAGGIRVSEVEAIRQLVNRVKPKFYDNQFDYDYKKDEGYGGAS